MAYVTPRIDPGTNWPRALRTKIKLKFPEVPGLSPETDMGFPVDWQTLDLWNYTPAQ